MRFLLLAIFIFLSACQTQELFTDDLARAKQACARRDWSLAERVLERYLREENDSEKRWAAWNLLLEAINGSTQEPRASLECLDVMVGEYENDDPKMARILSMMGRYNQSLRHYERAANAWSAYTELGDLLPQDRVEGFRHLAQAQASQRHFAAADETLQQCLGLPLADHDKIWCMLDLAETNSARQQWKDVADLCQQILDSDPDPEVAGLAGYLRGDALEQLGKKDEALAQFEQARDKYPNPAVMDNRIGHLHRQLKANK